MRSCILAFALVALATPASAEAQEAERVNRTIKLDPGGTLRLKNFSGRVTITASDRLRELAPSVAALAEDADVKTLDLETYHSAALAQALAAQALRGLLEEFRGDQ